jgi:hypothetical protein
MTRSINIRKRLRRYALFCLMAASTASIPPNWAMGNNTHDSGELCGWVEDLPVDARPQRPIHAPPPPIVAPAPDIDFTATSTPAAKSNSAETPCPFLAVNVTHDLTVDTCNYDAWLAAQLANQDIRSTAESTETTVESPKPESPESASELPGKTKLATTDISRTSESFNRAIAAIAASATAGNPIVFSHWTEPFAMVGPDGSHTPNEIEAFQAWFEKSRDLARQLGEADLTEDQPIVAPVPETLAFHEPPVCYVPVVDFDGIIGGEAASAQAPSAVTEAQPSANSDSILALVETSTIAVAEDSPTCPFESPMPTKGIKTVNESHDDLVGGSAVIVKVEESYAPYDMAEEDKLKEIDKLAGDVEPQPDLDDAPAVWAPGLFEPPNQPFCIRAIAEQPVAKFRQPGWSVLANKPAEPIAEPAAERPIIAPEPESPIELAVDQYGSPDCMLEHWIWTVGSVIEEHRLSDQWLRPQTVGSHVAKLVVSGDDVAKRTANQLAQAWPAQMAPPKPVPAQAAPAQAAPEKQAPEKQAPGAGAKLLARAEAAEQLPKTGSDEPTAEQQLAQAQAMLQQWVGVAQSVFDDVSQQWNDVIEVAQNRGAQDDSIQR